MAGNKSKRFDHNPAAPAGIFGTEGDLSWSRITGIVGNKPRRLTASHGDGLTPKPAGRARGMARGLTMLTMRRVGEFRLGVKTEKGVLDVAEAATQLHMHAPATVDELLQNEDGPSLNALVDAALRSSFAEKAVVDEPSSRMGQW